MRRPCSRATAAQPIEHGRRALLIGLHRKPQPFPTFQLGRTAHRFENIELQIEPIRFFRIDRKADPRIARGNAERHQARQNFLQHALALHILKPRMDRRQFHGNRIAREHGARALVLMRGDRRNRIRIGPRITLRIVMRHRRFAQHVERKAKAALGRIGPALQCLLDRAPQHELPAHDAHGGVHRLTDDRLAAALHHAARRSRSNPAHLRRA